MKFYIAKNNKYSTSFANRNILLIIFNKLTCVYSNQYDVEFYYNGKIHNNKNAAFISNKYKEFRLNGKYYGNTNDFTKQSWRRFVKLQAFL
jgi:hypothetical protein